MIELSNIAKTYRKANAAPVKAIDNVSLHIRRGEFVAILGPSGSGKSTLMNVMGLLDSVDSGDYRLDGKSVRGLSEDALAEVRNRTIGFVFQAYHLLPRTTAIENVQLPLLYANRKDYQKRSEDALAAVGLSERMHHFTSELSGGQQQRVAIARAISNDPALLLADEPTGNLDSTAAQEIMTLFRQRNELGTTVVMITHDLDVARCAQRIVRIRDGLIEGDQVVAPATAEAVA